MLLHKHGLTIYILATLADIRKPIPITFKCFLMHFNIWENMQLNTFYALWHHWHTPQCCSEAHSENLQLQYGKVLFCSQSCQVWKHWRKQGVTSDPQIAAGLICSLGQSLPNKSFCVVVFMLNMIPLKNHCFILDGLCTFRSSRRSGMFLPAVQWYEQIIFGDSCFCYCNPKNGCYISKIR